MFVYEVVLVSYEDIFSYEGDSDVWLNRHRIGIFSTLELAEKKANSIDLAENQYWEILKVEVDSEEEPTTVGSSTPSEPTLTIEEVRETNHPLHKWFKLGELNSNDPRDLDPDFPSEEAEIAYWLGYTQPNVKV